jgi:tetrahydromethanopterin S-methyltransferase subunit F
MIEPEATPQPDSAELERIHRRAPVGALAVAGIATGLVFALWLVFYLIVFLPRGLQQ